MLQLAARVKTVEEGRRVIPLGFNILEITLPCPGGKREEQGWVQLAKEYEIRFLGHGPQEGDPRDVVRLNKEYLPKLKEAILVGHRLQALGLTVHFWMESRFLDSAVIQGKIDLLKKVVGWALEAGVAVNLENLSESATDLQRAVKGVPGLGLTLDVGHAQLLQKENASPQIIANLAEYIRHIHIHDNHGGNSPKDDLHLFPGKGIVPFETIFKQLKSSGYRNTATFELEISELAEARLWVENLWDRI